MKALILATFVVFNILGLIYAQSDYCKLCNRHIACNNPGTFSKRCSSDASIVNLCQNEIDLLLKEHNDFRNRLAGGSINGFQSASKMAKLSWDNELAAIAELNVKQCEMKHDSCFKTQKYQNAGQNLYYSSATKNFMDSNQVLSEAVNKWANEYQHASQSNINLCCKSKNFHKIGHFLQVAKDKAVAVGCAASRYTEGKWKVTLVTCNYSYGNMHGEAVYAVGSPGSECLNGRDSTYNNLCS